MNKRLIMIIILAFMMLSFGQTIWNGGRLTFSKADYADATLAENQDRITDSTWVTRNNDSGLFNAYYNSSYNYNDSPVNTEWAYGTTVDFSTLNYQNWVDWARSNGGPPTTVGRDAVVHIIDEDIYVDIKFTSWTEDAQGGGFTYERALSIDSGPVDIDLSSTHTYYELPDSTLVGTLSTADGDTTATHTYSFTDGENHNNYFTIVGNELYTDMTFTDESKMDIYDIDLRAMDVSDSSYIDKHFNIMVLNRSQIWDGGRITFSKADYADATLAKNQDRITDSTWVTRNNQEGLFNPYYEASYNGSGPTNTEWAYGTTVDFSTLNYKDWVDWARSNGGPPSTVGQDAVVHLIAEDIYIDIKFTSWTEDAQGGGFTYERALSIDSGPVDIDLSNRAIFDQYPVGTLVGSLSSADGDLSANHIYSFADGDNDNSFFYITGNELYTDFVADLNGQTGYYIEIRSMDDTDSAFVDKAFMIKVIRESTIWTGPKIMFIKENYADATLPENQDRMADSTWITRNDMEGLFNAYYSSSYIYNDSPLNTEWAYGTTENYYELEFQSWYNWQGGGFDPKGPLDAIGKDAVVHIISEDIYLDIKILAWTSDGQGGGFIYKRSTPAGTIVPDPIIWTGPTISFDKYNWSDPSLEENQDRMTETTWLTRNDIEGLYNFVYERNFDTMTPSNTLWAYGTTDNYEDLGLTTWGDWHSWDPPSTVGKDAVLYLIKENTYIDLRFTYWSVGDNKEGGGFSYDRSTYPDPGPYGLSLSRTVIFDETPTGSLVAKLSTYDNDNTSEHTYSFALGGADNASFSIIGDELYMEFDANMLVQNEYTIKLRTTNDTDGLFYDRDFKITIDDKPFIWDGPIITFAKNNYADCTLEENQDRLTDRTWITRDDNEGIFNAFSESYYSSDGGPTKVASSPENTEWAFGTTADIQDLFFTSWYDWQGGDNGGKEPADVIGRDAVLHLIEEGVYIDIKFNGWTQSSEGGGFIYQRSTPPGTIVDNPKFWDGPTLTFTKEDYANYYLPENQDRLTETVWITRDDNSGLFNIANESSYDRYTSPTNTLWAYGTTANVEDLDFKSWIYWHDRNAPSVVNKDAVVYLIEENTYIDIKFTSWTESDSGGGFTLERSTYVPPILWTGPPITFTKEPYADWNMPENQDRMTDETWVTRTNNQGIFNIVTETGYDTISPENTEWAYGSLDDYENLTYKTWVSWAANNPTGTIGQNAVLHLISEDIYMDIKFTQYSGGNSGGGFEYVRSTPPIFIGMGTMEDPFQITNIDQLQAANYYLDSYFIVMNDIDASITSTWNDGDGFDPIGNNGFTDGFTGNFDGQNYTIDNLFIHRPGTDYIGLFGITGAGSNVSNVNLENIGFTGLYLVGGLSSKNNGTISDCFTSGGIVKVDGLVPGVGGITGWNNGSINSSYSSVDVNGTQYAGGLVGYNAGGINNCYSTGNANASGKYAGGLIAYSNGGTITNSYSLGTAAGTDHIGGLIGYKVGTAVVNSFWDTQESTNISSAGGIGKTTAEMKIQDTFTGWDFTSAIWYMNIDFNYGYPFLRTQGLSPFADGNGIEEDPYQVANATQLNEVRNYLDAYFIQIADVDLGVDPWNVGEGWLPIGSSGASFTGNYNGDGYKISSLTINSTENNIGLFGDILGSYISNVAVVDANVIATGGEITGILVGRSNGSTISNCSSSGSVDGDVAVGGLIGESNSSSTISSCYSLASVESFMQVGGGLIGGNLGSLVRNSYAMGDVTSIEEAGGLIGYTEGASIENCYSTGSITCPTNAGGLIGIDGSKSKNTILNSYWDTETSGIDSSAGGEGKATAEMKLEATYVSWDYSTPVWKINPTANSGYPYLAWQVLIPEFAGGDGTVSNPYLVSNATELDNVRNYAYSYFIQIADIDLGVFPWADYDGWNPIGNNSGDGYFYGNYDGDNYTISNLTIDKPSDAYIGLFGYVQNATLQNIVIKNANVTGEDRTGSLVGYLYSSDVVNCSSSGTIIGVQRIGGLIGSVYSYCNVTNCYSTCDVIGSNDYNNYYTGGLVGYSYYYNNYSECFATGNVSGYYYTGGFTGIFDYQNTINNCYSTGDVSGNGYSGGFVGYLYNSFLYYCYSTGFVTGSYDLGGLIGYASSPVVNDCFWDIETSGMSYSAAGIGKTTSEMMQDSTFTNWDFATVWGIQNGVTYPYLQWIGVVGGEFIPQNLIGLAVGADFTLTWDAVAGVTGYKVYASEDPYGTFLDVSGEGVFSGESWTYPHAETKRFFYVVSEFGALGKPDVLLKKIKRQTSSSR